MKIVSIVGARPEFIQAWPVSRALENKHQELLVHTGQHYDYLMSQSFFDQLGLPEPAYNLGIGSSAHGQQTGEMLIGLERVLLGERPDIVVVRGDTNSTLAGTLVASKLGIPLVHIEAGERSYQRDMPEEINRVVADRLAGLHLCASRNAVGRLRSEGIDSSAFWVGDVMFDAHQAINSMSLISTEILEVLDLAPGDYSLVTVHRAANTDDEARLQSIVTALNQVEEAVVFPIHPRTRGALGRIGAEFGSHVRAIDPVGYLEISALVRHARLVATDSGGLQREAYFARVPCLTLREETEWTETVDAGWNRLVGTETYDILRQWIGLKEPLDHPPLFGDGRAADRIVRLIEMWAEAGYPNKLERLEQEELLPLETKGEVT